MKEATGELNTTLITVLAIAMLLALFSTLIFPNVLKGLEGRASCADAVCDQGFIPNNYNSYCYSPKNKDEVFQCPYRG